MKVQVNNKEVEITPDSTLTQLTAQLELPVQGIAIAVNNKMIPRTEWEGFILHENDNLVIIKAACGGEGNGQSTIYHASDRTVLVPRIGTYGTRRRVQMDPTTHERGSSRRSGGSSPATETAL